MEETNEGEAADGEAMGERERKPASWLRWGWEWAKILATTLLLFVFIRSFVVEAFQIPTASMETTLLVGDFLLVNKAAYGAEVPGTGWEVPALDRPEVGEVVVFRPPRSTGQPPEARFVKRIVGAPGDTLVMREGTLWRNGRKLEEPYARHVRTGGDPYSPRFEWQERYLVGGGESGHPYRPTRDHWGPVSVPADSFFVLGDNRDNSEDSRYWGFVPRDAIEGRPLFIYFSYDRETPEPLPWMRGVRWGRLFEPIE